MTTDAFINILKEKNIDKWKKWLANQKVIDEISFNKLSEALVPYLQVDSEYFQFAEAIWDHFINDEDRQSLLWIWIEDIYQLNEDYASFLLKLLIDVDKKVDYDLLVYLFDLLTIYYLPKMNEEHIDFLKTEFFKKFISHPNLNIQSYSYLFAFHEQLIDQFPNLIFNNFSNLNEKLQEQLLDPLFSIPYSSEMNKWIEDQINNSFDGFSARIKTGFIIHIIKNFNYHKNDIYKIKQILSQAKDVFIRETVLLFILPAENISQPLLEPIIEVYLDRENKENILLLLDHLPQFFDDWPQKLKEFVILKLEDHPDAEIRAAILRQLIAPTWINEELIIAGFSDKDEQVQNAAYQSAAIVFRKLRLDLKKQILKIIYSEKFKHNVFYGFFIGYNYDYEEFEEEIKSILIEENEINKESIIICLRGLILNWNNLPSDLQKLITNKTINHWDEDIKKSVYENFNNYPGVLDTQGRQLIDYISKENSFLSLNLDVIND